jgi:uncharacterized membrane protein
MDYFFSIVSMCFIKLVVHFIRSNMLDSKTFFTVLMYCIPILFNFVSIVLMCCIERLFCFAH